MILTQEIEGSNPSVLILSGVIGAIFRRHYKDRRGRAVLRIGALKIDGSAWRLPHVRVKDTGSGVKAPHLFLNQ